MKKFYIPSKLSSNYKNQYGNQAVRRLDSLLKLMNNTDWHTDCSKTVFVNYFFNQLEYRLDLETWSKRDYWASRLEFLGKGQGDCEDFAISKYLTLKQMGVKGLYLTYALIAASNERHLLVSYFGGPATEPVYLDNYVKSIRPSSQRLDINPVCAFTEDVLCLQNSSGLGKYIDRKPLKMQLKLRAIDLEIQG